MYLLGPIMMAEVTGRVAEPQGRAARSQHEVTDRCHFEPRGDWLFDPPKLAKVLQTFHKAAQISVFHINKLYEMRFQWLTRN